MLASERQYVSLYANDVLGITIMAAGVPADPDGSAVVVTMIDESSEFPVFVHDAERHDVGQYQVQLTSAESGKPGEYRLMWEYTLDGRAETYVTYIVIGQASPTYDGLVPAMKEIVDQTWMRFEDMFDAPMGGPNLQTYLESKFGRGRVAQLLRVAVGRLNTVAQPFQTYTLDGDGGASFPVEQWGSLLEQALYVEVIRHLRRSYLEQPEYQGATVARLDRIRYFDRWGEMLAEEEADLKKRLDVFKISSMNLGRPKVLVSGGVYGRYAPTRYAGSAAARGRFWTRMY